MNQIKLSQKEVVDKMRTEIKRRRDLGQTVENSKEFLYLVASLDGYYFHLKGFVPRPWWDTLYGGKFNEQVNCSLTAFFEYEDINSNPTAEKIKKIYLLGDLTSLLETHKNTPKINTCLKRQIEKIKKLNKI